ncbi:MAG: hypothetical protein IEMM0008_0193 [bacterium]|nr:MAG: hypothetical protein IEMM0008_0193 [bacterium]
MFKKLTIKSKIWSVLVLPFIGLIYFAATETMDKFEDLKALNNLYPLASKIANLVHETQKERGVTAGFMGSKGEKFKGELSAQKLSTDKAKSQLIDFLNDFDTKQLGEYKVVLDNGLASLSRLRAIRDSIKTLSILSKEAIAYYTDMNGQFLQSVGNIAKLSANTELSVMTTAYVNFLKSKERAGQERAILTATFASKQFQPGMYDRFVSLVAEQKSFNHQFLSLANQKLKDFYNKNIQDSAFNEVKRMRQAASDQKGIKLTLTARLQTCLGYGGIIHSFKNYILRGGDQYVTLMNLQHKNAVAVLDQYSKLDNLSTADKKSLKVIRDVINKYKEALVVAVQLKAKGAGIAAIDGTVKISDSEAIKESVKLLNGGDFGVDSLHWFNTITKKINVLKTIEDRISKDLFDTADQLKTAAWSALMFSIIITLVIFVISGVLSFFIIRSVVNALKSSVETLTINSEQVATGSKQIAVASQKLAEGSAEQASSLEETSASLEQIAAMTQNNADISQKANHMVSDTSKIVSEASGSMKQLKNAINNITASSEETGKIIKVIDEIAFQTNLLALNAAVEAARAGEAGMGFAVVADEVRNLAQRSAEAAKNTAQLIDNSIKKINEGNKLTKNTEQSFNEVVDMTKKLKELMDEVSTSSQEQSRGIEQITETVASLSTVTQNNSATSEESATASDVMNAQATSLMGVVSDLVSLVGQNGGSNGKSNGFHNGSSNGRNLLVQDHPDEKKNLLKRIQQPLGHRKDGVTFAVHGKDFPMDEEVDDKDFRDFN